MSWKQDVLVALGECCSYLISICWALLVRLIFIFHTYMSLWRVVTRTGEEQYWYLLGLVLVQLGELIYRVAACKGNEGRWVCPCFFFYLLSTIPSIWILELDRLKRYEDLYKNANITASHEEALSSVQGVSIPIKFSADVWVSVIEQSLLFLLILCRWILPRGEITRDQLSQLLFVYIGMASDIMELFVLFDEETVRKDKGLVYIILVVWSMSLFQFCLVLTATRNPKKARVATVHPVESTGPRPTKAKDIFIMCLTTEVWSLMVTFLMQDGPFLCVRLYALIKYNLITYNILFFACKNILVVLLLGYRLIVLCCGVGDRDKDNDDDEKVIIGAPEKIDSLEDKPSEKPANGNYVSVLDITGTDDK